ncbi:MAG: 5'-methylthioadenosine/S-adenosylhomocysteine nucleosidase [Actinomycetota bacterium]
MRRIAAFAIAGLLSTGPAAAPAAYATCTPRLLILSAFPGEIDPLLSRASIGATVHQDGREFFLGTLEGHNVVLALTGIGLVNAMDTTSAALDAFECFSGIVFSGVSGGAGMIGDVTIPARWTPDAGAHFYSADPGMLATAQSAAGSAELTRDVPLGDVACVGTDPDLVRTIQLAHTPQVRPGGEGISADPFDGRTFPCFPGGGDVFGCRPCRAPGAAVPDVARFANDFAPFLDPAFFFGFEFPATPAGYAAVDMETGAVAEVAAQNGIPFIAFRALSDGEGDPLMLPGFPFQFFVYRQIAADNAAAVALAFLRAWTP